jgi:hypothetical protein
MLPDSNTNEPASHGYIRYKIKQKANNPIGTKIKNTAYIYFDFNDPVITNTTLNTIDIAASINENKNVLVFFIYPNPTSGSVLINSQTNFNFVEVLSITGQTLLSEKVNSKTHQLQLQNFSEGIYFVKVSYADGRSLTKKVIKQ